MRLLLIPIIVILLGTISAVIFIGCGYLISLIIPLTLFQASLLCIGATFLLALIIVIIVAGVLITKYIQDYEDEEDKDDEIDDTSKRKFTVINEGKPGRNELCSCGSGKKYKYCCGK